MNDNELRKMVEEAASCDYIISHEIEKFTIEDLDKLTELARSRTVKVELHAEHSNFAQGTLVNLFKWPLPWEPDFDNMPVKSSCKEAASQ